MAERAAKVVLITGASSGLGAAVARDLAARGHRLAIVARRAERLEGVAAEVRERGGDALALPDDLADPAAPSRIVEAVVGRFGAIDAVVNNAAIGLPDYYGRCEPGALRAQVEVNLTAPIVLTRLALPHLIASKGVVVNIGSAITEVASPVLGVYGATKAGLRYWSDALRREVRHRGVRVCLVELGPIESEFFDAVGRADAGRSLFGRPPAGYVYNAMRDRPPAVLCAPADAAARRVARLIERPRRTLAVPRRVVWPLGIAGAFFRAVPGLADLAVSAMIRRVERERDRPTSD